MSGSDLCVPRNEIAVPRYVQTRIINVLPPNFYSHVSDLKIHRIGLPILVQPNRQTNPGNTVYKSLTDT